MGGCNGTALAQGLGLQHHAAVTHGIQFGVKLCHVGVTKVTIMQGKGCMDIGNGVLALGEGVAADLVSGDSVQVGVVHGIFQGCLNRGTAVGVVVERHLAGGLLSLDHQAVGI